MRKTLVLLSGGMDSSVALGLTPKEVGLALSVDYGQRHRKELSAANQVADHYKVPWQVLDLTGFGKALTGYSALTGGEDVPDGHYSDEAMKVTVVPNRNATFLMAAAGVAQARGLTRVVTAVHAGDHPIYPDCRPEFIEAANAAALAGTGGVVEIQAPFVNISKTDICALGAQNNVPFSLTWSCYKGEDLHCGTCGTCVERKEAFKDSSTPDPTSYLND